MMPKAMVRSGRAGQMDERPNPDFSFARLVEIVSNARVDSSLEVPRGCIDGIEVTEVRDARVALKKNVEDRDIDESLRIS